MLRRRRQIDQAMYLAEALARVGRRVLVVDADPQGTLLEWEAAAIEAGVPLSVTVDGLPSAVLLEDVPVTVDFGVGLSGHGSRGVCHQLAWARWC